MKSYLDEVYDGQEYQIGERYYVHDCPFCGSKKTDLYQTQVRCEQCDAHGPDVGWDEWPLAITLWNEYPRKQGDDLKKLRSYWSSRRRRLRAAEKKAEAERMRAFRNSPEERQKRADRIWAAEREAWLHSPIVAQQERGPK